MADNPIAGTFGNVFGGVVDISITVLVAGLIGIVILVLIVYFFYRKKFDILVKIISERASDPRVFFDKAAVLFDRKTKTKYLKLQKQKIELALPINFKILESTNKGDYIELYRKSEEDFVYLTKPKIDRVMMVRGDGKAYPIARTKQRQLEGDFYWAMKRKEENKRMLDPESLLMKLLAYAPQILSGAFMLIILFIFMDKLPEILNQLIDLTRELRTIKGVAEVA